MIRPEEIIAVGKFQKTHALKGELNMISEIDPEYFLEGNPLIIEYDGINVPYYVESIRPKGSTSYLVKLEGIENGEEASLFVNKEIKILKKDAEEWLGESFEEDHDFIGFNVQDEKTGKIIGEIIDIDDSTSNLLFIIEEENGNELYLPANEDLIVDIDIDNETIKMILPEGILAINEKKE